MLYGGRLLRSQIFLRDLAIPTMRLGMGAIHFLYALRIHLLKMNMSMMKKPLSPQEMALALEKYSIISTENMHSIKELIGFILQQMSF